MSGEMSFEESFSIQLELVKPSRSQIAACLETHPPTLTPKVEQLVKLLQERHIPVYLISGGFRVIIEPIAEKLQIPQSNVYANTLLFDETGNYVGFDNREPTSKNGGKAAVIRQLKEKFEYEVVVMIGDGVTDLEARPPADLFIGFGGNAVRDKVRLEADWFISDFALLIQSF